MKYHIIYVPGLFDRLNYTFGQRTTLALWRSWKVKPHYFVPRWTDTREPYEHKLQRLLRLIDAYSQPGNCIALVAASAGSNLALTAFAKRRDVVCAVVSICGKLHNPQTIIPPLAAANPAFTRAMKDFAAHAHLLGAYERKRVLRVISAHDSYVPEADGFIPGTATYRIFSAGHVFSIFMALTIYRHRIIGFIKEQGSHKRQSQ